MRVELLTKVENTVAKGEIACFEQFLLLVTIILKVVCCRGWYRCGKGLKELFSWEDSLN